MMQKVSFKNFQVLKKIRSFSKREKLLKNSCIANLTSKTNLLLQNEVTNYRMSIENAENIPGGLLDFKNCNKTDIIIVPDLHARKDFIYKLLNYKIKENSIFELIVQQKVCLIFLGDVLHSEGQRKERWLDAYEQYLNNNIFSDSMTQEMIDGLCTLMQVMLLKINYSENVHILKGNHENIKNETFNGNFSFHKFAEEGQMVYEFMIRKYGANIVNMIYNYENLLPLCAVFENVMVSHAEPVKYFSRQSIINSVLDSEVIQGLTWTQNDEAQSGVVKKMLEQNCSTDSVKNKYITGHRAVKQNYALRQDKFLVQIHNPYKEQFVYIKKDNFFNPEKDIIEIE